MVISKSTAFLTVIKRVVNCSLLTAVVLISCNTPDKPGQSKVSVADEPAVAKKATGINGFGTSLLSQIDNKVNSILQDKKGNYWLGTDDGVYRYDGKTMLHYTDQDGLLNNQVLAIQEDHSGNLWFSTGRFGVCRFDGKVFTTYTPKESLKINAEDWQIAPDDLWFAAGGGVFRYDGKAFIYLPLPKRNGDVYYSQTNSTILSPYAVYCMLKDSKGNLWLGTQSMGVCKYDGKTFTWLTAKGLAGPAIRGLFEDSKGNLWFGNNGGGLFRYDGKQLTNITREKGLQNDNFLENSKSGPGTLARVWTINEDNKGMIWIGTIDAGVWRYDGKNLSNYTTKNGLTSNAISTIYKDKAGELWFGTDGAGVCKFNGTAFSAFNFK